MLTIHFLIVCLFYLNTFQLISGETSHNKLREDTEEEDTIVLLDRRNNEVDDKSTKLHQRNDKDMKDKRDYKWPIANNNNNNNQLRFNRGIKKLARNYNYFQDYGQQRPFSQLQQFYSPYETSEESEMQIGKDLNNFDNSFKTMKEHENFQRYEPYPLRYKYNINKRAEDDSDDYDDNKNDEDDRYLDDETDDDSEDEDYTSSINNNKDEDKNDFNDKRNDLVKRQNQEEEEQETEEKKEEEEKKIVHTVNTEPPNDEKTDDKAKIEKTIETEEDEKETVENETEDEDKSGEEEVKKLSKYEKKHKEEEYEEKKLKKNKVGLISKDSNVASALRKQFFHRNGQVYEGYVLSPYKQKVGKKIRRIDVIRDIIPSGYTIDDIGNTLAIN